MTSVYDFCALITHIHGHKRMAMEPAIMQPARSLSEAELCHWEDKCVGNVSEPHRDMDDGTAGQDTKLRPESRR